MMNGETNNVPTFPRKVIFFLVTGLCILLSPIHSFANAPEITLPEIIQFNEDDTTAFYLDSLVTDDATPASEITWQVSFTPFTKKKSQVFLTDTVFYELNDSLVLFYGAADIYGDSITVYFLATDTEMLSDTQSTWITINPVNDAPRISIDPDTSFYEDSLLTIPYQFFEQALYDIDGPDSLITFYITRDSGSVYNQFNETDSKFYFQSEENADDAGYLTINATDNERKKAEIPFIIDVIPINDAPVLREISDTTANQDEDFKLCLPEFGTDPDNDFAELTWTFSVDSSSLQYNTGDDTLIIRPPENYVGKDTFIVTVQDPSGLMASDTIPMWFRDNIPPNFIIGVFQNPVASNYLNIYFFPDEPIDSVKTLKISGSDFEATLIEEIEPNPWFTELSLTYTNTFPVLISATDTADNIGTTEYTFTATSASAKKKNVISSPGSEVKITIPENSLQNDQYLLFLPKQLNSTDSQNNIVTEFSISETELKHSAIMSFKIPDENKNYHIECFNQGEWIKPDNQNLSNDSLKVIIPKLGKFRVIEDECSELTSFPEKFSMHQNYPNPFNAMTTISFDIPYNSKFTYPLNAKITIYDLSGRKVTELFNSPVNPGNYKATWNCNSTNNKHVPSGVYFYTLQFSNQLVTRKMVLLK